jgi:hypothetical protein
VIPYDFLTEEERIRPIDEVYYIKDKDADFFGRCMIRNGAEWVPAVSN